MKGKQTSRGNSWHVKQHGNGQWAVYDPNSKFRRTFATRDEAKAWADEQQATKGKR